MDPFPHYFQSDPQSSGIASLQIICKHYRVFYNQAYLNRVGSAIQASILSLRHAAEILGFRTRIDSINLADVKINNPCIIQLRDRFVVLYKIKKNVLYISDPESGLTKLERGDILHTDLHSECPCLLLEPTHNFNVSEHQNKTSIHHLVSYLIPYKKLLFQVLIGFLAASILSLLFPFLTQSIVDIGIGTANINFITLALIAQGTLMLSQTLIEFIRNWVLFNVSQKILITLVSDFLIKLLKLPIGFFQIRLIGDLRQRLEDHTRIHHFISSNIISMAFGIFMFLMYSIVIGIYNFSFLTIYYAGSILYLIWIFSFLKKRKELDNKRFKESVSDQNKLYEMLTGVQDIKLNGWANQKRWEWERIQLKLFKISLQSLKLSQIQNMGAITIAQMTYLTLSFLSATAVVHGNMTLGTMMALQFIIGQLNGPVNDFVNFTTAVQDTKLSIERIREINNEPDETSEVASTFELPANHAIEVRNLDFGYTSDRLVLKNINLHIPQGKVTAIVGESGSGKTTLLKLLLRYFRVQKGEIRIGEISLNDLEINAWRSSCGAVTQDGIIFSDTLINNIALNHSHVNNKQLEYAVHVANIKDLVNELPQRYDTIVGQGGFNLSQGQKQRVLIARAVYRNPSFLFFDEATNALDSNNESAIVEKLKTFYFGRTVVVIAHRLSTVQYSDQIIVLHQGSIVEIGNHNSLLGLRNHYYSLVKNQLEISS